MPNNCTNILTITSNNKDMLDQFIEKELHQIEKHNTSFNEVIKILKKGNLGIVFKLWSAWGPDTRWFETVLENYPEFWIKNEWSEEGGMAGVWIGYMINDNQKSIESLTWRDLSIEEEDHYFS